MRSCSPRIQVSKRCSLRQLKSDEIPVTTGVSDEFQWSESEGYLGRRAHSAHSQIGRLSGSKRTALPRFRNGLSALDYMLAGGLSEIADVRSYLDKVCN